MNNKNRYFFIKLAYWLGAFTDALWAIILLNPAIFKLFFKQAEFSLGFILIMSIGGILMTGWTVLLIWAVQKPIERRFVILLTAIMVLALSVVAFIGYANGNNANIWIILKTTILFIAMIASYVLSAKEAKKI